MVNFQKYGGIFTPGLSGTKEKQPPQRQRVAPFERMSPPHPSDSAVFFIDQQLSVRQSRPSAYATNHWAYRLLQIPGGDLQLLGQGGVSGLGREREHPRFRLLLLPRTNDDNISGGKGVSLSSAHHQNPLPKKPRRLLGTHAVKGIPYVMQRTGDALWILAVPEYRPDVRHVL